MESRVMDILSNICGEDIVKEDKSINLFESGLLDSLAFAELLIELEGVLNIEFTPTEINRKDIETPEKLIHYLKTRGLLS